MAKYHQIQDKMWTDMRFRSWDMYVRYIFITLIANPGAELCGVQEQNIDTLHELTAMPKEFIQEALAELVRQERIIISQTTQEIAVVNYIKHNVTASPKQHTAVIRQFESVKDKTLLPNITGATKFLPRLKQLIKQVIPTRKQPDELSTYDRTQLRIHTTAALADLRTASFS